VRGLVEWAVIIVVALAGALAIRTFVIGAYFIPSGSMYPTLRIHDRVLVNKLSYDLHGVHRGDIVVFKRTGALARSQIKDLIKRVIGLSGDTIEAEDGHVLINDKPLREPYLRPGVTTENLPRQVVPRHHVFVMGDNRGESSDSRFFGPIDDSQIIGRAFVLIWPFGHWALL